MTVPEPGRGPRYGSDLVVDLVDAMGINHVALNPGASIRGLHESLVHAGHPALVLVLHEEVGVAVAHGYAKAAGRPMAVLLHDLVGLQHAAMAIFNAWVDQVPVLLVGGSGPADSRHRRPWIDWIHSVRWQSLAVREVVKWDDQPVSIEGVLAGLTRAYRLATVAPQGPTYVDVDALLQEAPAPNLPLPDLAGTLASSSLTAGADDLERAAALLVAAERPVVLADLVGRSRRGYQALVELAEMLAAPVVDLGGRHNFPSRHWADLTDARAEALAEADLVLSLDLRDVRWGISEIDLETHGSRPLIGPGTRLVTLGLGDLLHRGFNDREGLVAADVALTVDTAVALPELVELVRGRVSPGVRADRAAALATRAQTARVARQRRAERAWNARPISPARIAGELWAPLREVPWLLANGTLSGWARRLWDWDRYGCFLGQSGGAGLGYGVGASIGAALAAGDDGVVVDLQTDGDLLYTASALWTAARERIPLLIVVENNRTYGKDRLHQATVAQARRRGQDLIHLGIDIDDPPIDLARLAEAQGVEGIGPVTDPDELRPVLERAMRGVCEGRPVLVDVIVGRG